MIWACVLLACWAGASRAAALAQSGCFIVTERRSENSCHREIICKNYFSYVGDPNRCYSYRGKYGTDLSLYNFTEKSIKSKSSKPLITVDIDKVNATFSKWPVIPEDVFSFCKNARTLNISNNQIEHLKNGSFYSLTKLELLDLSYNKIYWVKRMHFSMISSTENSRPLKTLLLSHNNIFTVENDAFADLQALENLDLSNNQIQELNADTFHNLHFLTKLRLEHNKLKNFDNYKDLINLRSINVSNNQITHIFINTYILSLDASNNNVSTVDFNMFNKSIMPSIDISHNNIRELHNTTLKHYGAIGWASGYSMKLDLSFNSLDRIHYNAFAVFYNIIMLDLSHNKLHSLKINPEYLKQLTEIHLQHNKFHYIGKMFERFDKLEYLDISNNELAIGSLHRHSFAKLSKLHILKIRNNGIRTIDNMSGLEGLTNLIELDMSNNSLHYVNFTGASCYKLAKLSLRSNNITDLKTVELHDLLGIRDIDISDNTIQEIVENSFRKLYTLKHLNLSKNDISEIHPAAFFDLNQLKTLDLSNNNLQSLKYGSFEGLANLHHLDLSSNELRYVKMNAFLQLRALRKLMLDDNDIVSIDHSSYRIPGTSLALSIGGNHLSCDWLSAAVSGQLPGHPSITILSKVKNYSEQFVNGIKCIDYKLANFEVMGNTIPIGLPSSRYTEEKPNKSKDTIFSVIKKQNDIMENIEGYVKDIKELMENKDEHINSQSNSNEEESPEDLPYGE